MLKRRLIPVVLMRNGEVVQSRLFRRYQRVGRPANVVERLANWSSDELVFLDISRNDDYDIQRGDLNDPNFRDRLAIVRHMARVCAMPLTFGGRIRSVAEAKQLVLSGADKIAINTLAHTQPETITDLAKALGSQAVVISMDVLRHEDGRCEVYAGGRQPSGRLPGDFAHEVQERGAGEILLNAIHRDGTKSGYDLDLICDVEARVTIPIIALGGAGQWEDMATVCRKTQVTGIAAANIFHHTENSVVECKQYLYDHGFPFRRPTFQRELGQRYGHAAALEAASQG